MSLQSSPFLRAAARDEAHVFALVADLSPEHDKPSPHLSRVVSLSVLAVQSSPFFKGAAG